MKNIIWTLLTLFILTSCKDSIKTEVENNSVPDNPIAQSTSKESEPEQTELLVQRILDLPKLQWIYHPELKERLPIKVLETEKITRKLNFEKFEQEVRILSLSELEEEKINDYVVIEELKIKNDTADFKLSYKIEGAGASGRFIKENGEWNVLDYTVWEN